jgi:Protein of unknown function (DUF2806)
VVEQGLGAVIVTNEDDGVLDALVSAASGVPDPVKRSVFKSFRTLLGEVTRIPTAWLHQKAQSVDDQTLATTQVSQALAKAVAEKYSQDPAIIQAAAEIYLPSAIRKAENRVRVAKIALDQLSDDPGSSQTEAEVDDDWLNAFSRFAEDASSERLRDLFGRVLAGEIRRTGSYGLSTLRAVSELDPVIAQDFSIVWEKSVGEGLDYSEEFQRGEGYLRWMRLAEAGLLAPTTSARFTPPFNPVFQGFSAWRPFGTDDSSVTILASQECNSRWTYIPFTRIGREIASILPKPDFDANFRLAALKFQGTGGVQQIMLMSAEKGIELLWKKA